MRRDVFLVVLLLPVGSWQFKNNQIEVNNGIL